MIRLDLLFFAYVWASSLYIHLLPTFFQFPCLIFARHITVQNMNLFIFQQDSAAICVDSFGNQPPNFHNYVTILYVIF